MLPTFSATPAQYEALVGGRRKCLVLTRTIGLPPLDSAIFVAEVVDGVGTGKAAWARVTWIEAIDAGPPLGPVYVLSLNVRTSGELPALRGATTLPAPPAED